MPDEEMIEKCRVAAIEIIQNSNLPVGAYLNTEVLVLAVIKAMREPTEKIIKAADVGMQSDFYPPDMTWQIMIDEILK